MFIVLVVLSCVLMASLAAAGLLLSAEDQVGNQGPSNAAEPAESNGLSGLPGAQRG